MSNGPLALVGGREWEQGCDFDAELARSAGATEVLIIAAAAAYERPERMIAKASSWFAAIGLKAVDSQILTRADANDESKAARVRSAKFVYLSDGSAMHLRSVLKDSLVLAAIEEMWRAGGAVAGSSAGAMVMTDPMVDPRGGAFTLGFGFAETMTAVPHWERWTGEMSQRMIRLAPKDTAIAEIEERTALIAWTDGTWDVQGAGKVNVIRNGEPADLTSLPSLRRP